VTDAFHRPGRALPDVEPVLLQDLVTALGPIVDVRVLGPARPDLPVRDSLILDASAVPAERAEDQPHADLVVLTGDRPGELADLAPALARRPAGALLVRDPGTELPERLLLRPVLVVPRGPQWSEVLAEALRVVGERRRRELTGSPFADTLAEHTDLFDVAKALGLATGTLISIEDERARVMAFSPYSDHADPIRKLAILGREPPQWHVAELRAQRVYDRLRVPGTIVDLPESGVVRRRLGIGMMAPGTGAYLGTIWAQETDAPFGPDLKDALVSAARYAARLVSQARLIHTMGTELVQRLLDPERQQAGDYSPQLRVREPASFGLIGLEAVEGEDAAEWLVSSEAVAFLSIAAASLSEQSMVAPLDGRLYVLIPGPVDLPRDLAWAERTVKRLGQQRRAVFRAGVSSSQSAASVRDARVEIERVCTRTTPTADRWVVTLDSDRTAVLIAECLDALPKDLLLEDERFQRLADYDARGGTDLLGTARVWLENGGEYAPTARTLMTHQNTIRYRIGRLESLSSYDLSDPDDRLLLALQLRLHAGR